MGNCLILQSNIIKVVTTEGEVLEYKTPTRAHQVLSEFPSHVISNTLQVSESVHPNTEMIGGHLYYLLPAPPPEANGRKVKFFPKVVEDDKKEDGGTIRIKIVITKEELKELLRRGSIPESMASLLKQKEKSDGESDSCSRGRGWKPLLESIPEV